ncbi:hypothetical protein GCM10023165_45910 [Variovorax defluvii]|uniref:Ornithine carbamoyltransferase n=1 Tax=Variovorax defluvii TaxID=913761 RepID=A0ABP8IA58_9BURK
MSSRPSLPELSARLDQPLAAASLLAAFAEADGVRSPGRDRPAAEPLRGRNLAVLLGSAPVGDTPALSRAAQELGAKVAELRFAEPAPGSTDVRMLARMLGRMYDAVDCGLLAAPVVRQIEREAGVPVYRGLFLDEHPARAVADLMTLHECSRLPGATMVFAGDSGAPRAERFLCGARELGFKVILGAPEAFAGPDVNFFVDARHSPHWTLREGNHPVDEPRRAENHRCVIKAILLDTLARP